MRVLDLDLDFFLNGIARWVDDYGPRLDENDYWPWPEVQVRSFLEKRCGLSIQNPIKGRVVEHHHEAFLFWRELIEAQELGVPFQVVHIDAHSDLGLGDAGYFYIMTHLLHQTLTDRMWPDVTQLKPGNYLAFAVACRWLGHITFVLHPRWRSGDLMLIHFKDYDPQSGYLQLKKWDPQLDRFELWNDLQGIPVLEYEPEIPIELVPYSEYLNSSLFDFAVLSQSPGYTPRSSDLLISVIREYLEEV